MGKGERSTLARINAVNDIRNFISLAVANAYFIPRTHPSLILNMDATQFQVNIGPSEVKVI